VNEKYSQFRDQLSGHWKQYIAQQTKEPKKLKWIGSAACEIILADLRPLHGVIFGKDDVPAINCGVFLGCIIEKVEMKANLAS
jgi:hypothetical protein